MALLTDCDQLLLAGTDRHKWQAVFLTSEPDSES